MPRARAKIRKHLGKKNPKIDVMDEYEWADIDRDEQEAGLKRRERRWKEVELAQKQARELEKKAIDNAEKIKRKPMALVVSPLEEAWLRCDYLLFNIMETKAYEFMEWQRLNDPDVYKYLYRKFMSKYMMANAEMYVDYFAKGGKAPKLITLGDIVKRYRKYKGIKTKFKIVHKGEEDREL